MRKSASTSRRAFLRLAALAAGGAFPAAARAAAGGARPEAYSSGEIVENGHRFFGSISRGLAEGL
jgi:hypothetical protein